MASASVRIIFDQFGNPAMIIKPDNDKQLQDSAFAPPGCIISDIPTATYQAARTSSDVIASAASFVAQTSQVDASTITARAANAAAALLSAQLLGAVAVQTIPGHPVVISAGA